MMYGYGSGSMMGGWSVIGSLMWIVLLIDLILAGVWLWQHISKR